MATDTTKDVGWYQANVADAKRQEQAATRELVRLKADKDATVEALLNGANELLKAQAGVKAAERALANFELAEKQAGVRAFTEAIHESLKAHAPNMREAGKVGIDRLVVVFHVGESGDVLVDVRPSGPGVLTKSAPRSGGGGRGTLSDGRSWAAIARENNIDPRGASAHLVVAHRLPEVHAAIPHDCGLK